MNNNEYYTSEYQEARMASREKGEEILAKAHEAALSAIGEYGYDSPEAQQAMKNYDAVDAIVNIEVSKQILLDQKYAYEKAVEIFGEDSQEAKVARENWHNASWGDNNNHKENLATAEAYMKKIFGDDSEMYKRFDKIYGYSKSEEKGWLPF